MQISFYGAAQTVTGSCFLLETANRKIMVDCGMFQGYRVARERNYLPFAVEPSSIDFLLLTHAHIDHSGLIPKLYKHGFRGQAFATDVTVDLLEVLLPDSGYIQETEVERINRKSLRAGKKLLEPIYTAEDAFRAARKIGRVQYDQMISLAPDITVRFTDAGHILGSAIVELWVSEGTRRTKIVFSGDLGAPGKPYVKDPSFVTEADYLLLECTYGNRLHKDSGDRLNQLRDVIQATYRKGGNLIIPAFAVERTQDLVYDLNLLRLQDQLPPMQIYIDSPMAVAATEVFKRHPLLFNVETNQLIKDNDNPLTMPGLHYSRTADESRALNEITGGAIIISASGMCEAGRIKHHLKHNLWRPEATVLFVGYQAPGTKGRHLLGGADSIRIHGEEIAVRANIANIDSYSSHADQNMLIKWVNAFTQKPQKVFLVHGDPEALDAMSVLVPEKTGLAAYAPAWQETIQLTPGTVLDAEELHNAYAALAAKMDHLLQSRPDQLVYNKVMRQIKDLECLLESNC